MNIRKIINKTLEWLLVVLMGTLVIVVLWQVTSRYIMSSPSNFTDELAGYLLIWVGLIGAAYVAGRREHLAIDLLLQRSSPERRFKLEILICVFIILFSVSVMTVGGSLLVFSRFYLSVRSAAMGLPLGYVYLALPISGLLITYFNIEHIVKTVKDNRKK